MSELRERRPRGRRKVRFEEVLPSTDLPPLVQGDLRCFLVVDIGKIVWSSTATAQVPPASPAYVRLRWWGETSDGTLFKPASSKNPRPVKCRCRFGVRSGAKQMCAYFVDMGSIVLEVLTSPKSVPLGRIQIPKVASLSSSNPIHDYFPIISPSSRKIGELHIHIRFKPLEDIYEPVTETGTDTSMSSRSRPPSEIGRRSRSRGSSVGSRSNRGSARSRSSSTGSRKTGKQRKRSTSRKKSRRRSQSTESNASSVASKKSLSIKKASTIDSSTPRGIDDLLKQNGHDFYGTENIPQKKSSMKPVHIDQNKDGNQQKVDVTPQTQDAISALLQRGNRLREDMLQSQLDPDSVNKPRFNSLENFTEAPTMIKPAEHMKRNMTSEYPNFEPTTQKATEPAFPVSQNLKPMKMTPVKEQRQDLDMRFVNLVFGSHEFNGVHSTMFSGFDSHTGSPLSSMISELEDNPLYDDSLLQQMFYNNNGVNYPSSSTKQLTDRMREIEQEKQHEINGTEQLQSQPKLIRFDIDKSPKKSNRKFEDLANQIRGVTVNRLQDLSKVYQVRIIIETLSLDQLDVLASNKSKLKKGRGKGSKPPVPSPKGKRRNGTYFVEFRFPEASNLQRDHPSSMTTSHDVTRVASRKLVDADGTIIVFDECCDFQLHFNEKNLQQWMKENLEFFVFCRKPSDKKASPVGSASLLLKNLITSTEVDFTYELNVKDNLKSCGTLKVSIELVGDWRKPEIVQNKEESNIVPDNVNELSIPDTVIKQNLHEQDATTAEVQESSIAISPSTSLLYMMLMVQEGTNIPGTTVISPTDGTSSYPPNVSLVCRSLTSGESEKTPVVWGQTNPKFNFVQISPLKLDNALLTRMQNNFVIVEVWTKITSTKPHSDKLLGLVKLSTHHFYQSLKDEEITRVVLKSQHPLISVDEPVPIIDLFTGQERGHLQVTLALGTQLQVSSLRKIKNDLQDKRVKVHHLEDTNDSKSSHKMAGPVQHTFEVNVVRINGFKPADNQVWGETDCFIQYQFPTQKSSQESSDDQTDDDSNEQPNLASMHNYRTDATLCIPDPSFNDSRRHTFHPPPSVPLQRILLSCCYSDALSGGIPFELWSRYYHPNVRDQLLAKGMLPIAKVSALVSMTTKKVSEQTFHIPLEFVDPEHQSNDQSAGRLEVHVKYNTSGTTLKSMQSAAKFTKPVILQVGLLRACGLKAAAVLASRHSNDGDLKNCADIGVNTYVEIKPSFLPDEETRRSRIVVQSFVPEYQHHLEIACPLVSFHQDITPISLAELMISGEIELSVWHRPEDPEEGKCVDTLLCSLAVPMRSLLHKTTGLHSWFALKPAKRHRSHGDKSVTVGGLEISINFSCQNDLDLVVKAAKANKWILPHFETKLLNDNVIDDVTGTDCVTFAVTVTNAWLPQNEILLHGRTSIDRNANVYLRYKFFDHDSVTSSLSPLSSKQPHSIGARFENLTSARIAHKKSFVCKRSRPLNWYLREEKLELQIWLTRTKGAKKSRPLDSDKLLGSCFIDLCTIADLQREQHISGSFDLFKAGIDDLGSGQMRVYISTRPGDVVDPIPDPIKRQSISEDDCEQLSDVENIVPPAQERQNNDIVFSANVTIERAMHLPQVGDFETDSMREPNCFVSYDVVDESYSSNTPEGLKMITMATKVSLGASSPCWNESKEVVLSKQLLTGSDGALLLKVWHRDRMYLITENEESGDLKTADAAEITTELLVTDRMLGFATVDLSVLRAGFRDVNGWYNVLDIHGQCQGQLKVAVTPSTSFALTQPDTARSNISSQKSHFPTSTTLSTLSTKGVNFLHQAPIDVPVQTPSGSMYFPGLQSSAQTVGTTCKMTDSEENKFLKKRDKLSTKFSQDFTQNLSFHQGPSASMFRYTSSDRQQACLVNTLEKQIKELEEIKTRFENRRAAGFTQNASPFVDKHEETQPKVQNDNINSNPTMVNQLFNDQSIPVTSGIGNFSPPNAEFPLCMSSTDMPNPRGETILTLHPNRTESFDALPELEIVRQSKSKSEISSESSKSTISSRSTSDINKENQRDDLDETQRKTVHLSLYEPQKTHQFDERALSDNEANPDVEFVQPRSLNESMCSDFQPKSLEQKENREISSPRFESSSKKPPHKALASQGTHFFQPEPSALTPARSEGRSVLDETSLWLSGSTLRISGFSSDDDDQDHSIKPRSKNGKHEPDKKNSTEISPQLEDATQNDTFTLSDGSQTQIQTMVSLSDSEKESTPVEHVTQIENIVPKSSSEHDSESSSDRDQSGSDQEDEQRDENFVPFQSENASIPNETEDHFINEEKLDDDKEKPDKKPSPNYSDLNENEKSDFQNQVIVNENNSDSKPIKCENDENVPPNVCSQEKSAGQKQLFPSFFPPTRDLEASMRALQEATLKHKHDLLKKKECSQDVDQESQQNTIEKGAASPRKLKKIPPMPKDYSDERTQRLARIFRTKFS
ncbi:C2 domain-containing protein 3-like isoform X1 [Styela clava]